MTDPTKLRPAASMKMLLMPSTYYTSSVKRKQPFGPTPIIDRSYYPSIRGTPIDLYRRRSC